MNPRAMGDRIRRSRFARNVGALWIAQALVAAAGLAQGILVARWLGPAAFGVAALVLAVPSLMFTLMDARASDAGVRYLGEFNERAEPARALAFMKAGVGLDLGAAAVTLLLVAAVAPWAARHVVHDPGAVGLLVLYSVAMLIRAPAATSEAVLVTLTRYRRLAVLQGTLALLRTGLVISFVADGRGVSGVVWGTSIGMVLEGVVMLVAAGGAARTAWEATWWRAPLCVLRDRAREIARFVIWADVGSLVGVAAKQVDLLLVGAFGGAAAAGFYRLARSLGSMGGFVVGPLQSVLYQRFSKLRGAGDERGLVRATRAAVTWVSLPLAVAGVLSIPFVPWVVTTLAGPTYEPAVGPAQVMVFLTSTWFLFLWVRPLVLTLGEVRLWALIGLAVAIFSLAGFALLVPAFGPLGAAWVRYVGALGAQLVPAWVVWRRYARGVYVLRPAMEIAAPPAGAQVGGAR